MSQNIEPALSAEQWRTVVDDSQDWGDDGPLVGVGIGYTNGLLPTGELCNPFTPAQLITLLNNALPDSDPRKITWQWIDDERAAYHDAVILARHAQDVGDERRRRDLMARAERHGNRAHALKSYLPPERDPG